MISNDKNLRPSRSTQTDPGQQCSLAEQRRPEQDPPAPLLLVLASVISSSSSLCSIDSNRSIDETGKNRCNLIREIYKFLPPSGQGRSLLVSCLHLDSHASREMKFPDLRNIIIMTMPHISRDYCLLINIEIRHREGCRQRRVSSVPLGGNFKRDDSSSGSI